MAVGIGIDSVVIEELGALVERCRPFLARTFTEPERAQAHVRPDKASYLAGRFAVKEAVAKALLPLSPQALDLRRIECLDGQDGAPRVTVSGELAEVLDACGASKVLVSITNESGTATAIALVE